MYASMQSPKTDPVLNFLTKVNICIGKKEELKHIPTDVRKKILEIQPIFDAELKKFEALETKDDKLFELSQFRRVKMEKMLLKINEAVREDYSRLKTEYASLIDEIKDSLAHEEQKQAEREDLILQHRIDFTTLNTAVDALPDDNLIYNSLRAYFNIRNQNLSKRYELMKTYDLIRDAIDELAQSCTIELEALRTKETSHVSVSVSSHNSSTFSSRRPSEKKGKEEDTKPQSRCCIM